MPARRDEPASVLALSGRLAAFRGSDQPPILAADQAERVRCLSFWCLRTGASRWGSLTLYRWRCYSRSESRRGVQRGRHAGTVGVGSGLTGGFVEKVLAVTIFACFTGK